MTMNLDPFRELDRLAGALLGSTGPRSMPLDLYRTGDHYVLDVDLPGIDPGSVDIDVDGSVLTIRAERTLGAPEGRSGSRGAAAGHLRPPAHPR